MVPYCTVEEHYKENSESLKWMLSRVILTEQRTYIFESKLC